MFSNPHPAWTVAKIILLRLGGGRIIIALLLHLVEFMRGKAQYGILTLYEGELCGELWRYLGDDVRGQVAGDERSVSHQVVDGVGDLHQLAVGQVCGEKTGRVF